MGTEAEKLSARANRHAHDIRNGGYRGAADCMDVLAAALKADVDAEAISALLGEQGNG